MPSNFWNIGCSQFNLKNTEISYQNSSTDEQSKIFISQLNTNITNFSNYKDSVKFNLDNVGLYIGKNFNVESKAAEFAATKKELSIKNLNITTQKSEINKLNLTLKFAKNDTTQNSIPDFDLQLAPSIIDLKELSEFLPAIKGMNQTVNFTGEIYGNMNDLKGKNVIINVGNHTNANLDFYINGLKNPETMYLFLDLKNFETTFDDISAFNFPTKLNINNLEFPESFYDAGVLQYKGNFSGFLSDFVTYGTLKSSLGTVTTDLSVVPQKR